MNVENKTELTYTLEEIKQAGKMVSIQLEEDGFKEIAHEIEKITPKQIHFKEAVYCCGRLSKTVDQKQVLQQPLRLRYKIGANVPTFYVASDALVLEKDVEEATTILAEKAKKTIQDRIAQLQKQLATAFN